MELIGFTCIAICCFAVVFLIRAWFLDGVEAAIRKVLKEYEDESEDDNANGK